MNESKRYTLAELAALTNSKVVGNPSHLIDAVADLESATSSQVTFLDNPRYQSLMQTTNAGAVFVHPSIPLVDGKNYLINESPSKAFQIVVEAVLGQNYRYTGFEGIYPSAIIHPTAKLGINVQIGPHAVIDQDVQIGAGTKMGAGVYIGPQTTIGANCIIHPHVTIRERCIIGSNVVVQPGAVIGSCGFGFFTDAKGKHTKLNQFGNVVIEDDVEIGANTTIDRARFKTTVIRKGTKIDNLVQIGHGVIIGEDNLIVAQTGVAGSSETGKNVILAGQTALAGHIKLGDGVILAARSAASKSLPTGKYGGAPAIPLEKYNHNAAYLRTVEKVISDIKQRLENLENKP